MTIMFESHDLTFGNRGVQHGRRRSFLVFNRPRARRLASVLLSSFLAAGALAAQPSASDWKTPSPDQTQELAVTLRDGRLTYRLDRVDSNGGKVPVLAPSPLGLDTDVAKFTDGLQYVS